MMIEAVAFGAADEAIERAQALGRGRAIRLGGELMWVSDETALVLEEARVEFDGFGARAGEPERSQAGPRPS
jgi:hypothetical protein